MCESTAEHLDESAPSGHQPGCLYRPESTAQRVGWIVLGAILGAVLGFCVSYYLVLRSAEQAKLEKTRYWLLATSEELDYNVEMGLDSQIYPIEMDDPPVKAEFSTTALEYFLTAQPEFVINDEETVARGRKLLRLTLTCNKHVELRNSYRNTDVVGSKGSLAQLQEIHRQSLENIERDLDVLQSRAKKDMQRYRQRIDSILVALDE